jgi:Arm domain-containing DNA-binding protein
MALGSYPDMELAEARKTARAKRTLVDAGRDPLLEKQNEIEAQLKASAAKKARGKFRELAEDWYETEIAGGRLKLGSNKELARRFAQLEARIDKKMAAGQLSLIDPPLPRAIPIAATQLVRSGQCAEGFVRWTCVRKLRRARVVQPCGRRQQSADPPCSAG